MGCKLAWVGYKILFAGELALEENPLRKSTRSCRQRTRLSSWHPLAVESDGQPARAAMRAGIPDQFMILGEQLRHAALSAGTINDILVLNACASGL